MGSNEFLAHISEDGGREQTLEGHLAGTAKLAGEFGNSFKAKEQAEAIALIHDVGKASSAFQRRLHGGPKVDHSTAGAQKLNKGGGVSDYLAAYCVAGHHAGLPDGGTVADVAGLPTLRGRLKKKVADYSGFANDDIKIPDPRIKPLSKYCGFSLAFYTRMLFSCLVDADYLDTEEFMSDGTVERKSGDSIAILLDKLENHVDSWLHNDETDTINGHRTEILRACMEKGHGAQGLYTLTVPTGGGKTVSSIAFALRHAKEHQLERIIYVIPYISIIEQTADIFRKIFGDANVLEDHSNILIEDPNELQSQQLAAENYDKPVIVTTNVQFFESLFSNKSSKCRKLHNLAKSVIIFDEAQMLPVNYLYPCIRAIGELVGNYNSTAVICTATQPAIIDLFPNEIAEKTMELCPDKEGQYNFFKRTNIINIGEVTEDDLTEKILNKKQVLCILNRRKSVRNLCERICKQECEESVFHLSTWMYSEHRRKVLKNIRDRLNNGQLCKVVATSLIEAGVDVDFPFVLRETAGIDSIIQAGGRCNREGKLRTEECETDFFTLLDDRIGKIPADIRQPIAVTEEIADKYDDISTPDAIHEYFSRLYYLKGNDGLDTKNIVEKFDKVGRDLNFPFDTVSKSFKLIDTPTKSILILRNEEARDIACKLRAGNISRNIMRKAGVYSVSVYEWDFEKLYDAGRIEMIFDDFAILLDDSLYSEKYGLIMDVEVGTGFVL